MYRDLFLVNVIILFITFLLVIVGQSLSFRHDIGLRICRHLALRAYNGNALLQVVFDNSSYDEALFMNE